MRSNIKSIIDVLSANLLITFIGIIQTFLLPYILGPTEFGYWSLYMLYVGYAGFFVFGFCDGFYLKFGGKEYKSINKELFSAFHLILVLYLALAFIVWILIIDTLSLSDKRNTTFFFIGVGGVLFCYRSYFILLNQATARFTIYAKGQVIEKIFILVIAFICIFIPNVYGLYIILASIVGQLITVIYFIHYSRDIVFAKPLFNKEVWLDVFDNIKVGFTLTLASVGAMLITGIGRFMVEGNLGVKELGYYSLMFSVSVLFTQMINAISSVTFPLFRRVRKKIASNLIKSIDQLIINSAGALLVLYYPARYFLTLILPRYEPAMDVLLYLFPIIICQSRMTLVYNTIYKVLRFEKQLLKNALISLVFGLLVTLLSFKLIPSKESIAFATYLTFLFWNIISIQYYRKKVGIKVKSITIDTILSFIYIGINLLFGFTLISFILAVIIVLIVTLLKINETTQIIKGVYGYLRGENHEKNNYNG